MLLQIKHATISPHKTEKYKEKNDLRIPNDTSYEFPLTPCDYCALLVLCEYHIVDQNVKHCHAQIRKSI